MSRVLARRSQAILLGALVLGGLSPVQASAGRSVTGRTSGARGPSVSAALQSLLRSGAITQAAYQQDYAAYVAAKRSLGKLSGTRRTELGAVLANVQAITAAGGLSGTRAGALLLTLERNRQWWTTEPLLSSGERLSFPNSKIVWQYYPGQGIEIQWLATFGKANGFYLSGHENANLRQLLSEVIPLATKRAGGIAWEYLFHFDGGAPPWTSGLSQGTAVQVLSRAWSRFKEPADLAAAQQALGVFQTPPPVGVQVRTAAGALYAEYTYAPTDRILNGFIQSLVGLYEYTSITKDPLGLQLFEAGDAEARAEVPHYDTGAWSLYDQFGESSLNYHELLTEFLQHLCERTRKGPPFTPAGTPTPAPAPGPSPGGSTGTGGSSPTGGASATGASTRRPTGPVAATAATAASTPGAVPIAGDQIYCTTAQQFTADLHTPPVVALLTSTLRGGTRAGVQISLSKVSTIGLTIRQGGRVVWRNNATVERGRPKLLWTTPPNGGTFSATITAADPAGNFATASGTIVVKHR
jgi:hypothetical protein